MPIRRTQPDAPRSGLGASRARVLELLQHAGEPLGVQDVAERTGLHPNTARFHLDGLVEGGLATRRSEERDQPGRPRALYAAEASGGRTGPRSYRLLAQVLTSYLAAQGRQPAREALAAGAAWGRELAGETSRQRMSATRATDRLVEVLDEIGFAPEAVQAGRERQVLLHHCPFREAAEQHREVVCSVHLGLMRGLLDGIGAPVTAERLDPFVEPDPLCVTHLAMRAN